MATTMVGTHPTGMHTCFLEKFVMLFSGITFIKVASRELGIPMDLIHITETATYATPNASTTAGSVGCDLVAPAVLVSWYLRLIDNNKNEHR